MSVSTAIHEDINLARAVRDLALEGYTGPGKPQFAGREKYQWLREEGSRLWLDTGELSAAEKIWAPELEAVTTNNTLVNQVVQTGAMDDAIRNAAATIRAARPDIGLHDLVVELAFLANARLALSLVQNLGAHVSVELHPDTAFDVHRSLVFARRYFEINPSFFYIKVPLTPAGFLSTRKLWDEGIPVNFTLGFSARQNYLATRFSHPRFVNVFLGRLNQLVDQNHVGKPENVGEKVALASDEAVKELRKVIAGIDTQQIAASMRDGKQVAALAGIDVLTIPPKVAEQYLEMQIARDKVRRHHSQDLLVEVAPGIEREIARLWEIDERFVVFVDDAVENADQLTENGLVDLSRKHGMNLFHGWTAEDRTKLRAKGKIPDLNQWPDAPIDDLMSISALESFAKDQLALDQRIEELVRE